MTLASDRKTQIILAAIECISRYGYSNFSMQDLAQIADVSKGIIHYYFLNKEALMMAVLEYVCNDIEKLLDGNEHIIDPKERLSHVIWIRANIQRTKREYYKILMEFWTQIDQKDHVKSTLSRHYNNFRNIIAEIVDDGMKKNSFQNGCPVNFAKMIMGMIDGLSLQWYFDESLAEYDELIKNCEQSIMKLLMQTAASN